MDQRLLFAGFVIVNQDNDLPPTLHGQVNICLIVFPVYGEVENDNGGLFPMRCHGYGSSPISRNMRTAFRL